jgi:hypothetical protein
LHFSDSDDGVVSRAQAARGAGHIIAKTGGERAFLPALFAFESRKPQSFATARPNRSAPARAIRHTIHDRRRQFSDLISDPEGRD